MRVDTGRLRVVEPVESAESGRRKRKAVAAAQTQKPPVDPDALEHRTPGAYIKHHRKRKGVSLDQLAALTKIPRAQLELLEADQYERLPGMVFAKGFMRCCARSLELDLDTVLGLLYEREREHLRARRREASVAASSHPSPRKHTRGGSAQAFVSQWVARLPSARILMWMVITLIVALIVLIAFTLASGQSGLLSRT